MTRIDRVSKQDCCICRACGEVCPVGAIEFKENYHGFKYPIIDKTRCVNCQKCGNVCPNLKENFKVKEGYPIAYAGKSLDDINRMASSSGGIFYEIAQIFYHDGYVAGAVFDKDFNLKHIVSNKIDVIKKMRGSKYVQSDNNGEFVKIKNLLKEKKVLFCGCPCQVAGLKHFIGTENDNLYTIDFICHGIPSQEMLSEYIKFREKRAKSKLIELKFRDKKNGWHKSCCCCCSFENGKKYYAPITVDPYMNGFLSGYTMKESCYTCKYKNSTSGSDITLGDFWGAEVLCPEEDDNKGLSVMIANTEKGEKILEELSIERMEIPLSNIIRYNKNYAYATPKNQKSGEFWEVCQKKDYQYAIKKYFCEKPLKKFRRKMYYGIRYFYYKIQGRGKPLY